MRPRSCWRLCDRGAKCLVQVAREWRLEFPGDCHGSLAGVTAVGARAQEPERAVVSPQPSEKQNRPPVLLVVLVAQARCAVRAGRRLALPVDQGWADRVVPVTRRGREAAAALVECERQKVRVGGPRVEDAALPGEGLRAVDEAQRGEDLDPGVASMDLQR